MTSNNHNDNEMTPEKLHACGKMQYNESFVHQTNWFVSLPLFSVVAVAMKANKKFIFFPQ